MKGTRLMAAALMTVIALQLGACRKEGPAEKAGRKLDNAVEDVGDKIEDATD